MRWCRVDAANRVCGALSVSLALGRKRVVELDFCGRGSQIRVSSWDGWGSDIVFQ